MQDDRTPFRIWGKDTWDVIELPPLLGIGANDLQFTFMRKIPEEVILSGFFSSIGLFHHVVTLAMGEKEDTVMKFLEVDHLKIGQ